MFASPTAEHTLQLRAFRPSGVDAVSATDATPQVECDPDRLAAKGATVASAMDAPGPGGESASDATGGASTEEARLMRFLEARFSRIDSTLAAVDARMQRLERTIASIVAHRDEGGRASSND